MNETVHSIRTCIKKRSTWVFFGIYSYIVTTHLYSYVAHGYRAFGYDVGIYRRIALDYTTKIGEPVFAFGYLAQAVHAFGIPVDTLIIWGYLLVACLVPIALYMVVTRLIDQKTGLVALFIWACSLTQLSFFYWYYYRNLIGILMFFCIWYAWKEKSRWIAIPIAVMVALHPISALPVALAMGLYMIWKPNYVRYALVWCGIPAILMMVLLWPEFSRYVSLVLTAQGRVAGLTGATASELTGQFISLGTYGWYSLLYIAVGIYGMYAYWRRVPFLSAYTVALVLCLALQLLLYRRFIVYIDIALIIYASIVVTETTRRYADKYVYATWGTLAIYLLITATRFVLLQPAGIAASTFARIETAATVIPAQSTLLATDAIYAPWVLGFAGDHERVLAPGMFDDQVWDHDDWMVFWTTPSSTVRDTYLKMYPYDVIYIIDVTDQLQEKFAIAPNIDAVAPGVWKYTRE